MNMKWYLLIAAGVVLYWYIQPARVQVVTHTIDAAAQSAATNARQQFAIDLARALGNPEPSEAIVLFIESWARAEGVPEAIHNPLATTFATPGSDCYNWLCVRIYPDRQTGVQATVQTLQGSYNGYSEIVAGIQTNDPQRALYGLAASPWGTNAATVRDIYNSAGAGRSTAPAQLIVERDDDELPFGNPLNDPRTRISQGYGIGTHAPSASWGAIDLVLDTPANTLGAPVYTTISGVARVSQTWPCGMGVEVTNTRYRVLYCHLQAVTVRGGQQITRATPIGYVGSTGDSSGPHLHYEIWHDGVNQNPLDYVTR